MIFEARAQMRKYKNPVKTNGFLGFFVGRVFFEKVTAVDGKSTKTTRKSAIAGTQISSKSIQDREKSLLGALSE